AVDLDVAPDGALFCLTHGSGPRDGALYRISYSAAARIAWIQRYENGSVHVRALGLPDRNYVLHASDDLVQWSPITTNRSATEVVDLFDTLSLPASAQRFYR